MQREYDALIQNQTWDLTDLPSDKKPLNCKWVFKRKGNGTNQIYKARLVVKGCAQRKDINFDETYSPVIRYNSIRYLFSLAVNLNLHIDQMDAITAFLQGELKHEIYMLQPEGFQQDQQVCRLNRSLYGLKQASRIWNEKLDQRISVWKDLR